MHPSHSARAGSSRRTPASLVGHAQDDERAEGGGVALEGGQPDVALAGLEPGHRRLGGPHPGRDLGLGEAELVAAGHQLLPQLAPGGGVVVNQSSSAAYLGAGGAYGVSKLALNGLTMALATELAKDGTRVVGIAPGLVGSSAVLDRMSPDHKDSVVQAQLIKRFGNMEDLCGMVLFFSSSDAGFITGQTFLVDGGLFPRP
jgi:NAD(P)-dependent dehydrogenase (short-subunit alcohol dehydrogenase family)